MRFLADESLDFTLARVLSDHGYDVQPVRSALRGASDTDIATMARLEGRVLLTEDRDFGRLVFLRNQLTAGVIYFRYARETRSQIASELLTLVEEQLDALHESFVVIEPGRVRLTRLPNR